MNSLLSYAAPERSTISGWEDTFPHSLDCFLLLLFCVSPHALFFVVTTSSCDPNAARSVYPLVDRLGTTGQKACIPGEEDAFSRDLEISMVFQ